MRYGLNACFIDALYELMSWLIFKASGVELIFLSENFGSGSGLGSSGPGAGGDIQEPFSSGNIPGGQGFGPRLEDVG